MKHLLITITIVLFVGCNTTQPQPTFEYLSPHPGAELVSPGTTIIVRPDDVIDAQSLHPSRFQINGTQSGPHSGAVLLSDDNQTIIFKPDRPFMQGEQVSVTINTGIKTKSGQVLDEVVFNFTISPPPPENLPEAANASPRPNIPISEENPPVSSPTQTYLTLPPEFPIFTVTTPANGVGEGYIFLTHFPVLVDDPPAYLLIVDNSGDLVYYKQLRGRVVDFKKQPNGLLTYWEGDSFKVMDNTYTVVDTYQAGNGYHTDLHELLLLPNDHALLMVYDEQIIDMNQIVPEGNPTASVKGLVIQELDADKNVVFQWRSWDHLDLTDTAISLTEPSVDYVHGNAIELDSDGNLLISSRHLNEITKISRQTGEVIWRLGGKKNQFTFINDTAPYFEYQHDIRRLPNGNITIFDNRTNLQPQYSRVVEYQLDEDSKTATLVWEQRNTPDTYAFAMANAQRLPNGNTLVGWGTASLVTEFEPDGSKAFELALVAPHVSYRAFRFPWQGYPTTQPTLVVKPGETTTLLAYSWNGATEIASYRLYGGNNPQPTTLIATQPKTGFETQTFLSGASAQLCYFRIMPIDKQGNETQYSNEVKVC